MLRAQHPQTDPTLAAEERVQRSGSEQDYQWGPLSLVTTSTGTTPVTVQFGCNAGSFDFADCVAPDAQQRHSAGLVICEQFGQMHCKCSVRKCWQQMTPDTVTVHCVWVAKFAELLVRPGGPWNDSLSTRPGSS